VSRFDLPTVVPGCTLTPEGARLQARRYEGVAPSVTGVERSPQAVRISFDAQVDRALLDELIEVERECCLFFRLDFDEHERALTVAVEQAEHAAALDVIAERAGATSA
jgi:hypothetical protein